eukprot:1017263-Pyramimonas_sp.AAC.1
MVQDDPTASFEPILNAVLDPLLVRTPLHPPVVTACGYAQLEWCWAMCAKSAELLREGSAAVGGGSGAKGDLWQCPSWAPAVFLINCLTAVQQPLSAHAPAAAKCEALKQLIAQHLEEM